MNYSRLPFPICHYVDVYETWPSVGNHIMGTHDTSTIILYLNCKENTARFIGENKNFKLDYNHWKIQWVLRPTFLAAVQASDWGRKPENSGLLALTVTRRGFEELMETAVGMEGSFFPEATLSWVREKDPLGHPLDRSAIEVRIAKGILDRFMDEMLVGIEDVTLFLKRQRKLMVEKGALGQLLVPDETPYTLLDAPIADSIKLDPWEMPPIPDQGLFRMDNKGTFEDRLVEQSEITPPLPPLGPQGKLRHPNRRRKVPLPGSFERGVFQEECKPRHKSPPVLRRGSFDSCMGGGGGGERREMGGGSMTSKSFRGGRGGGPQRSFCNEDAEVFDNWNLDVIDDCPSGPEMDCPPPQEDMRSQRSMARTGMSRGGQSQYKMGSCITESVKRSCGGGGGGGGGSIKSMSRAKSIMSRGGGDEMTIGGGSRSKCGGGGGGGGGGRSMKSMGMGSRNGGGGNGRGFNSLEDECEEEYCDENFEEDFTDDYGTGRGGGGGGGGGGGQGRSRRGGSGFEECDDPGSGKIWDKIRDAINDKYLRDEELDIMRPRNRPKFNIYD